MLQTLQQYEDFFNTDEIEKNPKYICNLTKRTQEGTENLNSPIEKQNTMTQ